VLEQSSFKAIFYREITHYHPTRGAPMSIGLRPTYHFRRELFLTTFRPAGPRPSRTGRARPLPTPDTHRINNRILAREVRVIDEEGGQLGIFPIRDAVDLAESKELDLVEVAPEAKPPVCRIMDYGKFKYREQKKEAEARKKRTEATVKEIRLRYRTDVGDLETKLKHAREFLQEGEKVKFLMRFKGREAMYLSLGQEKFEVISQRLSDIAQIEEKSPLAGRSIHMVLAPAKPK
jgi:translation initiation factor IF-3